MGRPKGSKNKPSDLNVKKKGKPFVPVDENYKHVGEPIGPSPIDPTKLKLEQKVSDPTADKQFLKVPFLESLRKYRTVFTACQQLNVSRQLVGQWMKSDQEFKRQFKEVLSETREVLFQTAFARAMNRQDKGSTALLIFLMKTQGFSESHKVTVDVRIAHEVVIQVINALKKVSDSCPSCHNHLDFKKTIADELITLSKKFDREEVKMFEQMENEGAEMI